MSPNFVVKALEELGLISLWSSPIDTKLLCLQRFIRMFAYGSSTLILVSYLSALDISKSNIGLFMTLTLIGGTILSFILTIFADGVGRRAILLLGAFLMTFSGVVFALVGNYWVLLAAAVVGVISPRYFMCAPRSRTQMLTSRTVVVRSDPFVPLKSQPSHTSPPNPVEEIYMLGIHCSVLPDLRLGWGCVDGFSTSYSKPHSGAPSRHIEWFSGYTRVWERLCSVLSYV